MRKIKHLAEVAERERERLDAALTNMAQGLCMFDAGQRLVVFNPRVAEIFKIPPGKVILGMSMRELMMMAQASDKDPEAADAEQGKLLAAPASGTVITTLKDDTTLLITHRPMSNGGFVATFEDITDRSSGALRRPDWAAQSRIVLREIERTAAPVAASPNDWRPQHRPRPVQDRQRHARPSDRRPAAQGSRRAHAWLRSRG
jgi:nitrogen fixation/metabolism regulation signal transduction histidine kinase